MMVARVVSGSRARFSQRTARSIHVQKRIADADFQPVWRCPEEVKAQDPRRCASDVGVSGSVSLGIEVTVVRRE